MVDETEKIVEDFVFGLFRGDKMMPILYYLPPSPPCRAVLLLGRMTNIDFDLRVTDILAGDQMKPEFIQVCVFNCIRQIELYAISFLYGEKII